MSNSTTDTPMMQQYKSIKKDYPDAFLFYRLGDFYEMFYEDAVEGAQILELTLTARDKKADEPIPMCGIPYHAAESYIHRLIDLGHKVAICEQVEDPKTTKGMVKREVVQLITPGTVVEEGSLDSKANNYLTALRYDDGRYYMTYADVSVGEIRGTVLDSKEAVVNEISSIESREILLEEDLKENLGTYLSTHLNVVLSEPRSPDLKSDFDHLLTTVEDPQLKNSFRLLLTYLSDTQMRQMVHMQQAEVYETDHYLILGPGARKNLELQHSLKDHSKKGTLLWLLDETETAMGGRLLKKWMDQPLIDGIRISQRQDAVEILIQQFFEREDLKTALKEVYDMERLAGKVAFGTVNARDLLQLNKSLQAVPRIRFYVESINSTGVFDSILEDLQPLDEVTDLIDASIKEDAPILLTEGGIIKEGYHDQLDVYLDAMHNGKAWMANLEAEEREKTGIKNLKVSFNRVFNYYIEVTKSNLDLVPDHYTRKQTLANSERYFTEELKEKEKIILEAEEKSIALEYELFAEIREEIKKYMQDLQNLAQALAKLDVLISLAVISERHHFTRPELVDDNQEIEVRGGRHPVVEKVMGDQSYVPNDLTMDKDTQILLITGPNMSGKSTYMRQMGLIAILNQMGCFVPADYARLPIFDQIFTRIGAMDDLIGGQSTFMVEMQEANYALEHASPRSLILFDELGRGTATFDGMALAEAIIEYIHENIHAKTLFSTHYHELTALEDRLPRLKNVHVGAEEKDGDLVFLHKVQPGPTDRSYGVQVAKLAGLPDQVIKNASVILSGLEKNQDHDQEDKEREAQEGDQIPLFEVQEEGPSHKIIEEIKALDMNQTNPLEAFLKIIEWQKDLS